jgi:hypothetical protein
MNNADWWAKRLGQQPQVPQGRPDPTPQMPPSQQPMAQMPSFQQPPTTKAQSARQTATCPDCGSGNYFAIENAKARCYDCGYPVEQSGSRFGGLAGAVVDGSTKPATGNSSTSGFSAIPSGYGPNGQKLG